jgi:pyruvate kinase
MKNMVLAGMNVARLNLSHGDHDLHRAAIANLRDVCADTRRICALLLDTKGPEIRTGRSFKDGVTHVQLVKNSEILVGTDESVASDAKRICVAFSTLPKVVKPGHHVLLDDGLIDLVVLESLPQSNEIKCRVMNDGVLGAQKSVHLPGVSLDLPAVTQKDVQDIRFGVEMGVDFIAASFVRKASDVVTVKKILGTRGAGVKIIAKISGQEGLDNFDSILAVSDGIMIARGDLGVEIPLEHVALAQKRIIRRCNLAGKFVITATEMLESMTSALTPTRAEASDVANAVLDGTDCLMLNTETSLGRYPVETVSMMSDICREAEGTIDHVKQSAELREEQLKREQASGTAGSSGVSVTEAIASSSVRATFDLHAAVIIVLTETGTTARLVAKYRPHIPIITVTSSEQTARQSLVTRGLFPLLVGSMLGSENLIPRVLLAATRLGMCKAGDLAVVTSGSREATAGATNDMKVITVQAASAF